MITAIPTKESVTRLQAENYIRFGFDGFTVTNDENGRTIKRHDTGVNTLPDCVCFEGSRFIGIKEYRNAIEFLLA